MIIIFHKSLIFFKKKHLSNIYELSTNSGGKLDSRISDDDDKAGSSFSGGSTVISSNNNGVYHTTSQTIGPDGKVHTTSSKGPTSFSSRINDDDNSGVRTFTSGGSTVTTNNNGVYRSISQSTGPDGKVRTFSSRFNDDVGSGAGQNVNFPTNSFTSGYPGFPQVSLFNLLIESPMNDTSFSIYADIQSRICRKLYWKPTWSERWRSQHKIIHRRRWKHRYRDKTLRT